MYQISSHHLIRVLARTSNTTTMRRPRDVVPAFGCTVCDAGILRRTRGRTFCARRQRVRAAAAAPAAPDGDDATAAPPAAAPARLPRVTRGDAGPLLGKLALRFRGTQVIPSAAAFRMYKCELHAKLDYLGHQAQQRILQALEVAYVAHAKQKRKSGEPFIIHPVAVAGILAEMRMDCDSVVAGLLHDTVEDSDVTFDEIKLLFGADVCRIVEGETKISKLASKVHDQNSRPFLEQRVVSGVSKIEVQRQKQADNLRGMFLAMTEDIRVIIVKLADRLHNMRTLQHMKAGKQQSISKETLEFFAPLAHRLGMRRIKCELEELSFLYLHPVQYRQLSAEVECMKHRARFQHYLNQSKQSVTKVLQEDDDLRGMVRGVEVIASTKTLYEIFKRRLRGETLTSMLDIANLTVVIDLAPGVTGNDACYQVLGRIHGVWTPLPMRFKDYIAVKKPNGYQSLHTVVLLGEKQDCLAMEVQIRTKAMHQVAEEGIAAELFRCPTLHRTVAASGSSATGEVTSLGLDPEWRKRTQTWLSSIREYITCFSSSRDLVDAVRRDLLGHRVFVFTPKGRVINLPKDSTPVDLAYQINTDVGHKMIGARVNGNIVRLDHKLQNADIVKIITSSSSPGPSFEWIGYAKSRTAHLHIRSFIRARDRDNTIERGRKILELRATELGYPISSELALSELIPRLVAVLKAASCAYDVASVDDLYMAIAKGGDNDEWRLQDTVLSMLRDKRRAVIANSAPKVLPPEPVTVNASGEKEWGKEAHGGAPVFVAATCCHPVRGDEVMGIRSLDMHGQTSVMVHRLRCEHLLSEQHRRPMSSRVVGLQWADRAIRIARGETKGSPMTARFVVHALDCIGLLALVAGLPSAMGRSIIRAYTATDAEAGEAIMAFEVLVHDLKQLDAMLERIGKCSEVSDVQRVGPNEGSEYFPPQVVHHLRNSPLAGGGGKQFDEGELEMFDFVGDGGDDACLT